MSKQSKINNTSNKEFDLDKFSQQTYIFEKVARSFQETIEHIKSKYPEKNIDEWSKYFHDTATNLIKKNKTHLDLPKKERDTFYTSVSINAFKEHYIAKMKEQVTEFKLVSNFGEVAMHPLKLSFKNSQNPDFIKAKNAFVENIEEMIEKEKKLFHLEFKDYVCTITDFASYFDKFTFDMKNHHAGKDELTIQKNVKASMNYHLEREAHSFVFRFHDKITEAFNMVRRNDRNEIINMDALIEHVFCPKIWHGCGYCDSDNFIGFNHETLLLQEWDEKLCPVYLKKSNTDYLKTNITTTGKLLLINDVRNIAPSRDINQEVDDFGVSQLVSTYINNYVGQQGHMTCMAQLLNVGYIQAGNHYCYVQDSKKGLKLTYSDNKRKAIGSFSLSLWAACVLDYDKAIELAGNEEKLKQLLKKNSHCITSVKPGTYEVKATYKNRDKESRTDLAFGEINWINDETELKPLTEKEWQKLR